METLQFTPATVILLVIILACVVLAVRRLVKRGMCDCGDHCGDEGCSSCKSCSACSDPNGSGEPKSCPLAEETVSKLKP